MLMDRRQGFELWGGGSNPSRSTKYCLLTTKIYLRIIINQLASWEDKINGVISSIGRALGCGPRRYGFESDISPYKKVMKFKSLSNRQEIVDIASYIKDVISKKPETKIYIGTDSQNKKKHTTYVSVIVLHLSENDTTTGGHVLYTYEDVSKIKDRYLRLWNEVERSINVSNFLKSLGTLIDFVDLDFNENPRWESNTVLNSAIGYVESLGYLARFKPHNPFAVRVADHLCK